RTYSLELCGVGEWEVEWLLSDLATSYAQAIAGPAATAATLERDDLEGLVPLAKEWTRKRGIADTFTAALTGAKRSGMPRSQAMVLLASEAKGALNAARAKARDARSAIRELEAQAQGAEAAAAEIASLEAALDEAREAVATARTLYDRLVGAIQAIEAAEARHSTALARRLKAQEALDQVEDPGPRPEPPGVDSDAIKFLRDEIERYRAWKDQLRDEAEVREKLERELATCEAEAEALKEQIAEVGALPAALLKNLIDEIPDEAHELMPQVRALTRTLSSSCESRRVSLGESYDKSVARYMAAAEALEHARTEDAILADLESCDEEIGVLQANLRSLEAPASGYREALAEWEEKQARREAAERELAQATDAVDNARKALEDLDAAPDQDAIATAKQAVDELAQEAKAAEARLETARKAQGAVDAYRQAVETARAAEVEEQAWKHVGQIIERSRESSLEEGVRPVIDDVRAFLRDAEIEAEPYVRLENARGKPTCELGWIRDEKRVDVSAMSGGETVLYVTALAYAFAKRAPGRKVLVVECDALDEWRIHGLVLAL